MVAAVAMIAASSCNKVVLPENVFGDNVIAFTASFDGIGTKVKLEGGKSKWETTDKITIHNGTEGFVFNTEQSGESVSFLYDNTKFLTSCLLSFTIIFLPVVKVNTVSGVSSTISNKWGFTKILMPLIFVTSIILFLL